MDRYQMKLRPKPGEVLFYVELSDITNMTIAQALALMEELGHTPELRYLQSTDQEGNSQISLYALLKHEQRDPEKPVDPNYLLDEWEALAQRIEPSMAVHCAMGHPRRKPVAA